MRFDAFVEVALRTSDKVDKLQPQQNYNFGSGSLLRIDLKQNFS